MSSPSTIAILPGVPITIAAPAESLQAAGAGTAGAVETTTQKADWPDLDAAFVEAVVRRAVATVEAETPPALDPENSLIDRWALEAVPALALLWDEAGKQVGESERAVLAAARRLAALAKPWGVGKRFCVVFGLLLLCLIASAVVGSLMTGAVQMIFLKSLLARAWGAGEREAILYTSFAAAGGMALVLLGLQLAATVVAWGSLGKSKYLFLVADVCFSAAFGALRGGNALLPSIASGLFEGALLGVFSVALAVVDGRFRTDAEIAAPYFLAKAQRLAEQEELALALERREKIRSELAAQVVVLATRESLVRSLEARSALAEETARTVALTETAALISKATVNSTEQKFNDLLDQELVAGHADHRATFEKRSYT